MVQLSKNTDTLLTWVSRSLLILTYSPIFRTIQLKQLSFLSTIFPLNLSVFSHLINFCMDILSIIIFFVSLDICVFSIFSPTQQKLESCSQPCVFLGYPQHYLGYRCLDLSTCCIFVHHMVVFNQNSFSYGSKTSIDV